MISWHNPFAFMTEKEVRCHHKLFAHILLTVPVMELSYMSEMKIWGGEPLVGSVSVSGAKNGALPLLFASVVAEGVSTFYHVPDIGDVRLAVRLLTEMGAEAEWLDRGILRLNTADMDPTCVNTEIAACLRASSYLLGACLGRYGMAPALTTGGCDFGARPLNCHYDFFHAVGAEGEQALACPCGLHPTEHTFPQVSVGATVNALLTAARIPGETILHGCAREGHVSDLARYLNSIGAEVTGIGTSTLRIRGTRVPHGGNYIVSPDDVEAGTYLFAAAACGGDVTLTDVTPSALTTTVGVLRDMGCEVTESTTALRLVRRAPLRPASVMTAPAPGFPTDLHPPLVAAMLNADGEGLVRECVWQSRFRYTEELCRMGARLAVNGDTVRTEPSRLHPAVVDATDLRGGAALVIAALATRGRSIITSREILERGYEDMGRKLRALGAIVL